jgi:hypothetical protein
MPLSMIICGLQLSTQPPASNTLQQMMLDAPLDTVSSKNDSPAPPFIPPSPITLQLLFTMMVVPIFSSSMTLLYLGVINLPLSKFVN